MKTRLKEVSLTLLCFVASILVLVSCSGSGGSSEKIGDGTGIAGRWVSTEKNRGVSTTITMSLYEDGKVKILAHIQESQVGANAKLSLAGEYNYNEYEGILDVTIDPNSLKEISLSVPGATPQQLNQVREMLKNAVNAEFGRSFVVTDVEVTNKTLTYTTSSGRSKSFTRK